jgi:hypothetical protein
VTFLIKLIVDGSVDGGEFLQTPHAPEAKHRPLPSSERQVRILGPVFQPAAGSQPVGTPSPDFSGEQRAEPISLKADGFVADVDAALMQKIFDIPQRKRETDVQHDRQPDDLGRRLEIAEGGSVLSSQPASRPPCPPQAVFL